MNTLHTIDTTYKSAHISHILHTIHTTYKHTHTSHTPHTHLQFIFTSLYKEHLGDNIPSSSSSFSLWFDIISGCFEMETVIIHYSYSMITSQLYHLFCSQQSSLSIQECCVLYYLKNVFTCFYQYDLLHSLLCSFDY
jgi:hypothetical protein